MGSGEREKESVSISVAHQYGAVFAYNGDDHATVVAIYDQIKHRGLIPWIDCRDQQPGKDWRVEFYSALKKTSTAVIFFGSNGTGKWQNEEIPLIHSQCVAQNINAIPVILPGGKISEDMLFATRTPIEFLTGPNDPDALDRLEFGLTGHDPRNHRGKFEILAEVEGADLTCFLAVSHATSHEIYELMLQAALDAKLTVKQPREFSPDVHNVYTPDVVMAIRSAAVILVDGTPTKETKKADADVMYEVGLAKAFAKPIIVLSPPLGHPLPLRMFDPYGACSRIEYDPDETSFAIQLQKKLATQLQDVLRNLRPPYIISDNQLGLRVAYSEMVHHRSVFWQPFERVMYYGLTIKRIFADILKYVHKMQHIIELARADAQKLEPIHVLDMSHRQFLEVYEQFLKNHLSFYELVETWRPAQIRANEGLNELLTISIHRQSAHKSFQSIVEKTFLFFEILGSYLDEYQRAYDGLLTQVSSPSERTLHQIIHLHSAIQRLVQNAELIPVQACELMFQLMEVLGMRSELGGSLSASDT